MERSMTTKSTVSALKLPGMLHLVAYKPCSYSLPTTTQPASPQTNKVCSVPPNPAGTSSSVHRLFVPGRHAMADPPSTRTAILRRTNGDRSRQRASRPRQLHTDI